jgi:CubicO group peptidase (beta-lactamase class C family)
MSLEAAISRVMERAIADRVFPGGVVGVIRRGRRLVLPFGHLTYQAKSAAVHTDTCYDAASITKSIPTNALILKYLEEDRLHLDDLVRDYVPELNNAYRDDIRVKHLLTYTMVLDLPKGPSAHVREGLDVPGLWRLIYTSPLRAAPGTA